MYGHYKFGLRFIAGYCDLYFKFQWSFSTYLLEKDIQTATVEYTALITDIIFILKMSRHFSSVLQLGNLSYLEYISRTGLYANPGPFQWG